jgi:anti-sigma B factor antagonist
MWVHKTKGDDDMDLNINKHQNDKGIWVHVAGEIDAYTAPKLREELLPLAEGKNKSIIVNLKDVSYLDSTGLGVFVGLFKQLKKSDGELKLIDLSDRLKRLFEITGLSNIMNISTNSEVGEDETSDGLY